jgi:hypothetical protein
MRRKQNWINVLEMAALLLQTRNPDKMIVNRLRILRDRQAMHKIKISQRDVRSATISKAASVKGKELKAATVQHKTVGTVLPKAVSAKDKGHKGAIVQLKVVSVQDKEHKAATVQLKAVSVKDKERKAATVQLKAVSAKGKEHKATIVQHKVVSAKDKELKVLTVLPKAAIDRHRDHKDHKALTVQLKAASAKGKELKVATDRLDVAEDHLLGGSTKGAEDIVRLQCRRWKNRCRKKLRSMNH